MAKRRGLFKIIASDEELKGTAFAVAVPSSPETQYALTAYHVVSEQMANFRQIYLEDEEGTRLAADIVYPLNICRDHMRFSRDFAVLAFTSGILYQKYDLIDYTEQTACSVTGAIPYYQTVFTTLSGECMGRQKLLEGKEAVLQIQLNMPQTPDENGHPIPTQEIIRGISGAPVVMKKKKNYCIGLFANLANDQQGSMQYAVPSRTIIQKYFSVPIIKQVVVKASSPEAILNDATIVELIIGDANEFEFSDEHKELNAWNTLSDFFYRGHCTDEMLSSIIHRPAFNSFNPEVQCALNYFNARLLLKRGKVKEAFEIFQDIQGKRKAVTENTGKKLSALIECRKIIEAPIKQPSSTLHAIRSIEDVMGNIPNSSDSYIANELASTYGKGLTNFFAVYADLTNADKENIVKIYQAQSSLVASNPNTLRKQAVVTTLLEYFLTLWNIHSGFDDQLLENAIYKGFKHSKDRKNGIFYVTTLITYSLLCIRQRKTISAVRTLFLAIILMKKKGITPSHEGIKQLFLCMKVKFPQLYIVYIMFYYQERNAIYVPDNAIHAINLNIRNWNAIIDEVTKIYDIYYSNAPRIFDVSFNEIINLL